MLFSPPHSSPASNVVVYCGKVSNIVVYCGKVSNIVVYCGKVKFGGERGGGVNKYDYLIIFISGGLSSALRNFAISFEFCCCC